MNRLVEASGLELMLYAVVSNLVLVGLYVYICAKLPPRGVFLVPMLLGLVAVYCVHVGLTVLYWEVRLQFARTIAEEDVVIASDGANLLLHAMVLGPLVCVISAGLGITVFLLRLSRINDNNQFADTVEEQASLIGRAETTEDGVSINPYDPPRFKRTVTEPSTGEVEK